MFRKIFMILSVIFIIMQFFRIDKNSPQYEISADFVEMENPPENIALIVKKSCYDCHSHQTTYPWYSHIAPVSWWLKDHIDHGREHLNFSLWSSYDTDKRDHKFEEIAEEVGDGEMPLESYTWAHAESRLSEDERKMVVDWINSKR